MDSSIEEKGAPLTGYRVLLVGDRKGLPAAVRAHSRKGITAEVSSTINNAVEQISNKGYDAALCWMERDDELTGVVRIRAARPGGMPSGAAAIRSWRLAPSTKRIAMNRRPSSSPAR